MLTLLVNLVIEKLIVLVVAGFWLFNDLLGLLRRFKYLTMINIVSVLNFTFELNQVFASFDGFQIIQWFHLVLSLLLLSHIDFKILVLLRFSNVFFLKVAHSPFSYFFLNLIKCLVPFKLLFFVHVIKILQCLLSLFRIFILNLFEFAHSFVSLLFQPLLQFFLHVLHFLYQLLLVHRIGWNWFVIHYACCLGFIQWVIMRSSIECTFTSSKGSRTILTPIAVEKCRFTRMGSTWRIGGA